ncbi:family 20 glycosylhydrolase [Gluconobacter sp. Dm-62]|uniref:beta-N-acetylhexosaminidase n=1 Tax=Gluconobacter sp. Dm-62 TaxID=2799804 RepID=UPI001B8DA34E|nr:family 20 glycosylhydrolase [Gluconobacter sp. Dm-62]MBS1103195.1 family 20 glycosylhydrolase [Gluconobacter sp. Dm-62]
MIRTSASPAGASWKKACLGAVLLAGVAMSGFANAAVPALMPVPQSISESGGVSSVAAGIQIVWDAPPSPLLQRAASRFASRLAEVAGPVAAGRPYVLHVSAAQDPAYLSMGMKEHYTLTTSASEGHLQADGPAGVVHGLATLLQLVHKTSDGAVVDQLHVDDAPRFVWRGLLLDVSRHFVSADAVKRQLDAMELLKLNVLHWHLNDGTGFRVESHVFPKLTTVGSHGQFYTQDQVRDIVAYAADRGIRIVPEFDVPGHALSILQAYPALAAQPLPDTRAVGENLNNPAMDPTNPKTLSFIRALYAEMETLFPDHYFHSGGDEVLGTQWTANPPIAAYMKAHGYKDAPALQAAFTAQVEKILSSQGRVMMGWDEVSEAPIPKNVVVEGWRGSKWTGSATKAGHPVVVSSGYYLDLLTPSRTHYAVDPYDTKADGISPAEIAESHPKITPLLQAFLQDPDAAPLSDEQKSMVMGAEGALWTEVASENMVDARLWPRTAALAERFWSSEKVRDADDLERRLPVVMTELEATGLQAKQHEQALTETLAPGHAEVLSTLLSATVPVRNYALNHLAARSGGAVLSMPVAISNPDAFDATRFNAMAQRYAAGEKGLKAPLKAMLERWSANNGAFVEIAKNVPALEEVTPVSYTLTALSNAGLNVLNGASGTAWREDAQHLVAVQDEFFHNSSNHLLSLSRPQPPGGLLIAILPGIKSLLGMAH